MIFEDFNRDNSNPKLNSESDFVFLNRSVWPEIARVRDFVENCAQTHPKEERDELVSRIRCGNDTHFKSAIFELLLHSALKQLGCDLEPHPALENGNASRPDFMVTTPDGSQFYLEAVLASENNASNPAAESRKGVVIDALSSAKHENFLIMLKDEGNPDTQPSSKKLVRDVLKWLDTLDPDLVQATIEQSGNDSAPVFEWQHEGWSLEIRPIPLNPQRRGKSKALIGGQYGAAGFVDAWSPIRDAVKFKGRKYGTLNKPLIIAINFDTFHIDRIDEMQALYGQEQFIYRPRQFKKGPEFSKAPNGAWYGQKGPQYTRVSGVWIFNDLSPYTVARHRQTIYFNPWANSPLPSFLQKFPHAHVNGERVERKDGISFREIFGLTEEWPE